MRVEVGYRNFQLRAAAVLALIDEVLYGGPGAAFLMGQLYGEGFWNQESTLDLGDALCSGVDLSAEILFRLPRAPFPMAFAFRPFWRWMSSSYGYTAIADSLSPGWFSANPMAEYAQFASKLSGFGFQLEFRAYIPL